MTTARTRLAIAELTSTLTTDFDVPTLLHAVAAHARECFDAVSAVVILVDSRQSAESPGLQIVAEASRDGVSADPRLNVTGPGSASARDGVVAMIADLDEGADLRWPQYRQQALAAGLRSIRAFPVIALTVPLGSVVVHVDEPWGNARPNDFGQILADLIAIALSTGRVEGRRASTSETVEAVLHGTTVIAAAVGVLAEYFDLNIAAARHYLVRLARAHGVTPTDHARAIVEAQNAAPQDPGAAGILHAPPDLAPPRHIDI
ncbi:ANTAR domain-containing protein [Nocardia iowensis]|uniref:ANTAR domain-containing protein n=1 Tax=Nocardia iowensis TaxID=204891 RepID=A0ABX8RV51_NOCIO|nr:ANTAR domain-containing protein [Nocardia iowensis]QXN93505.1 ANTAR domain-containing protein [Nocardia iowensis]